MVAVFSVDGAEQGNLKIKLTAVVPLTDDLYNNVKEMLEA